MLDDGKLLTTTDLEYFFQLIEKETLLCCIHPWDRITVRIQQSLKIFTRPIANQSLDDDDDGFRVLFHVLRYAVAQLRVVGLQRRWLVERNQGILQEKKMLPLQRDGESVDDGAEYFE